MVDIPNDSKIPLSEVKNNMKDDDLTLLKLDRIVRSVKGFKFKKFWADSFNCVKIVKDTWDEGVSWAENIKAVQGNLSRWSGEVLTSSCPPLYALLSPPQPEEA
ncbi:hypothetical protein ACFE04_007202 [Oxalis oulophora]